MKDTRQAIMQFFVMFVIVDQLLLPMFHIGTIPWKPSYVILLLLTPQLMYARLSSGDTRNTFLNRIQNKTIFYFLSLITLSLVGQLFFSVNYSINDVGEIGRSISFYLLMLLAFILGLSHKRFQSGQLLYVFIAYAALHFLVTFYGNHFSWLTNLYGDVEMRGTLEVLDTPTGVLGLHSNPNGTMFLLNMILLGLFLGYKFKMGRTYVAVVYGSVIVISIIIAFQLGSRSGFVTMSVIVVAFIWKIMKARRQSLKGVVSFFVIIVMVAGGTLYVINAKYGVIEDSRLYRRIFLKEFDIEEVQERPFIHYEEAADRIMKSPIFGTGYTANQGYPFEHPTNRYHNDWLRITATSGLAGAAIMMLIIWKLSMKGGIIMLLPFILPGMTNTFLLNLPGALVYFLYVGLLWGYDNNIPVSGYNDSIQKSIFRDRAPFADQYDDSVVKT